MEIVSELDFFQWSSTKGVSLDKNYRPPSCLVYDQEREVSTTWSLPRCASARTKFISSVIGAFDPWSKCWMYKRAGSWIGAFEDQDSVYEVVEELAMGLGLPKPCEGVLRFSADERARLTALTTLYSLFATTVSGDVFLIADHARVMAQLGHHDQAWISSSNGKFISSFTEEMKSNGFCPEHSKED